jgi:putative membrane protein
MKHLKIVLMAGLMLLPFAQAAHAADAVSDADRSFIAKVSQGGMFEVQLGQLAASQGSTQDIKDQGASEAHDHQLVGDKLKAIASDAGIQFPDTLNVMFQKKYDDLKALSGPAFDRAYLADMEDIHAKDGAAFAQEAKTGQDPKLKAFAAETYRIVERHIGELKAVGVSQ